MSLKEEANEAQSESDEGDDGDEEEEKVPFGDKNYRDAVDPQIDEVQPEIKERTIVDKQQKTKGKRIRKDKKQDTYEN